MLFVVFVVQKIPEPSSITFRAIRVFRGSKDTRTILNKNFVLFVFFVVQKIPEPSSIKFRVIRVFRGSKTMTHNSIVESNSFIVVDKFTKYIDFSL